MNILSLKLKQDCSKDLVLICGDFNIYRYNTVDQLAKTLFTQNAQWADYFDIIDDEYTCMLETLNAGGKFDIVNLWDRDNKGKRCITLGECEIKKDGKFVPLETVLSDWFD